jgi:lipid-binding SYLF domain-containing protein
MQRAMQFFRDFGFKVMVMGGAGGKGMAVNNTTKQETFMKMGEFQPGLGLGAEKYHIVLIFENQDAFNKFETSAAGVHRRHRRRAIRRHN